MENVADVDFANIDFTDPNLDRFLLSQESVPESSNISLQQKPYSMDQSFDYAAGFLDENLLFEDNVPRADGFDHLQQQMPFEADSLEDFPIQMSKPHNQQQQQKYQVVQWPKGTVNPNLLTINLNESQFSSESATQALQMAGRREIAAPTMVSTVLDN